MSEFRIPDGMRARPRNRAGEMALQIYAAALKSVRADRLIADSVRLSGDSLRIRDDGYDLRKFRRILVAGAGKASAGMAAALEEILGDRITNGVVVTKHGHSVPTRRIRILEASHPIPDEDSVKAGRQIQALAESAGPDDLVIFLLSGGASALMELPAKGITLDELRATTDLLLRAGADITELNAVRSRLSLIKAGGLGRSVYPAQLVCLVISDVLGNPLPVIGSGPCWPTESGARPSDVLSRLGVDSGIPRGVRRRLEDATESTRGKEPQAVPHVILGDIWTAIDSARAEAVSRGLRPLILTASLGGEAAHAGRHFGSIAHDMKRSMPDYDCLIAGGETTVKVTGAGKGGRAQELAVAAAESLPESVSLLSAGTDGTDGPTDAAGALVDGSTLARAISRGVHPEQAIMNNDTYRLLEAAESLVFTGPTHTNVNDLVILTRSE